MLETSRIVTASTPQLLESRLNAHLQDGWQLIGPVQIACGSDVDGGWNTVLAATLVKVSGSGSGLVGGSGGPDPDPEYSDPLLDPDSREGFWDQR